MKMRNILIIILLLYFAGSSFSQKFSKFSDDSEEFLNELNTLFGNINDSDDKKTAECWMSSEGVIQDPFILPYKKEKSFIEQYEFFKSNESFFQITSADRGACAGGL